MHIEPSSIARRLYPLVCSVALVTASGVAFTTLTVKYESTGDPMLDLPPPPPEGGLGPWGFGYVQHPDIVGSWVGFGDFDGDGLVDAFVKGPRGGVVRRDPGDCDGRRPTDRGGEVGAGDDRGQADGADIVPNLFLEVWHKLLLSRGISFNKADLEEVVYN